MYAIHETILPPSAIHHSLFLPNFTPSTIYPLPQSHDPDAAQVSVVGNLVVAGGNDLRVFEIRESQIPLLASPSRVNGANGNGEGSDEEGEIEEGMEEDFYDTGHSESAPVKYKTTSRLHLLTSHQLHGTITGLAALRTIESSVDGLDRLLVSFKDAKMALLEWSGGDIATVSLHTYERSLQMTTGELTSYVPMLRTDPLSRMAVLTLPEDSLAVLPLLQELSELDPIYENFPRDVPYSPSFVLPLADVSPAIRNIQDLLFLPGFLSPTLAILYTPIHTWSGRYGSARDTTCLEIRTFDLTSTGSYPLLTSVIGLPSDPLYMIACPSELRGVVIVTTTGIVHVDQGGKVLGAGVNAWWGYTTRLNGDPSGEERRISLEGSRSVFVSERDMLLVLANGNVHQVRFEMDGRSVGSIKIDEQSSSVPPPSSITIAGRQGVFFGSAEGDSLLSHVDIVREMIKAEEVKVENGDMEVDYDEDLYGDSAADTGVNAAGKEVPTGPGKAVLTTHDRLLGTGKIMDLEFGIAATDQGLRTYPQLVTVSGGTEKSTFNVFRRGVPITKRRRFNELSNAEAVWFLPIQRPTGQRFKDIPDAERSTLLLSSEGSQTRIFALSSKINPEQIGRIPNITINAGTFFQRSAVLHVSPSEVNLLDSDGKVAQNVCPKTDGPSIVSASIADPYVAIRREDGTCAFFIGDSVSRTITQTAISDTDDLFVQAIDVFSDNGGIYRSFEAQAEEPTSATADGPSIRSDAIRQGQQSRMQLTAEQVQRLQNEKPAISAEEPSLQTAMNASQGSHWLALVTRSGTLQIRSLPDLALVLESDGLMGSEPSFADDYVASESTDVAVPSEDTPDTESDPDPIRQMIFTPIGNASSPRPHLMAMHASGRLNIYEAMPRFTLDTASQSRRSLAVRFRRVFTQLLPIPVKTRVPYTIIPFANIEGHTGAFITGEKPQWILSSDAHPLKAYSLKQSAFAFARTTHLGGTGEYFIRIEDGSFICYLPSTLVTDFVMPCDRYEMPRRYTHLAFDPPSAHYVGASAISVPFQIYDEEGEIQIGPEGPNLTPPHNDRSTLELFSQGSEPFRVIDGYDFDQNEVILCCQSVVLESSSVPGGYRDFIAVGTGFDFGEDRASRGNVYVFEVVETVGENEKEPGWRLKKRTKDPCRNPVSALSNINGYILHSNGPKMYIKGLDYDDRLLALAFVDVGMFVTSISVFKNLILFGDAFKSITFASLQDEPYKFTIIAKDLQPVSLTTADFLVHDRLMTFVSTDKDGVLRLVDFDPLDPESFGGERLILKSEYYGGAPIMSSKVIARRRTTEEETAPQSQIIYAHADGTISTIVAVKPARFKRLQLASEQLVRNAQHVAGLNPKAFRSVRNEIINQPLTKGILDGHLLAQFEQQPVKRQQEMMRQIGSSSTTVFSDLQSLSGFW